MYILLIALVPEQVRTFDDAAGARRYFCQSSQRFRPRQRRVGPALWPGLVPSYFHVHQYQKFSGVRAY